jgi:large subunit ribosomal protein L24
MKIKKSDIVVIIAGKDRGKNGKVLDVFPKLGKIIVDGVALKKSHRKPKRAGQKGQVVTSPSPFNISNAMFKCKGCGKGVRVGYQVLDNGKRKVRVCKKCKNEI